MNVAAFTEVDSPFPDEVCSQQYKQTLVLVPGDFLGKFKEDLAWSDHGKSNHLVPMRPRASGWLLFLQM